MLENKVPAGVIIKVDFDANIRFSAALYKEQENIYSIDDGNGEGCNKFSMDQDTVNLSWEVIPKELGTWFYQIVIMAGKDWVLKQKVTGQNKQISEGSCILVVQKEVKEDGS